MHENKLLHCISGSLDVDQVSPEFPMQSSGEYRPISTAKTYDYADCPHQYEELPHLQWVQFQYSHGSNQYMPALSLIDDASMPCFVQIYRRVLTSFVIYDINAWYEIFKWVNLVIWQTELRFDACIWESWVTT